PAVRGDRRPRQALHLGDGSGRDEIAARARLAQDVEAGSAQPSLRRGDLRCGHAEAARERLRGEESVIARATRVVERGKNAGRAELHASRERAELHASRERAELHAAKERLRELSCACRCGFHAVLVPDRHIWTTLANTRWANVARAPV